MRIVCTGCGFPRSLIADRCADCGGRDIEPELEPDDWNIAVINGEPELVINLPALKVFMKFSPLGEVEARRRLIERGVPAEYLED